MKNTVLREYAHHVGAIGLACTVVVALCLGVYAADAEPMGDVDWFFVACGVASILIMHVLSLVKARRAVAEAAQAELEEKLAVEQWNRDHPDPELRRDPWRHF